LDALYGPAHPQINNAVIKMKFLRILKNFAAQSKEEFGLFAAGS
jgi:hypothetical protein